MQLDSSHRRWLAGGVGFLVVSSIGYAGYVAASPAGPSGGSWPGLAFGATGTTFMVLAALLSWRKKVRIWRIGSAAAWMRMHLWLGLLAVPCIWFHSGFGFGGPLTTTLMVLFYAVTVSGIAGLILQQFVPAAMTRRVPLETVRGQIDHVVKGLAVEAYEMVASLAGPLPEAEEEQRWLAQEEEVGKQRPGFWKQRPRLRPASEPDPAGETLRDFYLGHLRPYLQSDRRAEPPDVSALLADLPGEWQVRLDRLAAICNEARQLAVQERLHAVLHGWLFVHAPLSWALLMLAAVHAVLALRY